MADHINSEVAITEGDGLYRSLFESMLNGFAYCRMLFEDGRPVDFIYLAVNEAFKSQTGLNDVVGKKVSELIPGIREADPQLFETYGRVAMSGIPERFEVYLGSMQMWFLISVYSPKHEHFVALFDVITERKKAEIALLESQQRLSFHVDNSPMATVEWDTDFIVTRWAGEAESIFGWTQAETIGKLIMDLNMIYEEDIPIVQETMRKLSNSDLKYVVSTNRNYTKDRKIITCEWYNTVLINSQGKMESVLSQVLDITERKQAEEALRRNLNTLSRTESITHVGSWEWMVATDTVTWSDELFRIHQLNPSDSAPSLEEQSKLYHPADFAELQRVVGISLSEGTPYELELRAIRRDGETRNCLARGFAERDSEGKIVRLFGSLQDITELKQAEMVLRKSEQNFRTIIEASPVPLAMNDEQGNITYLNRAFVQTIRKLPLN